MSLDLVAGSQFTPTAFKTLLISRKQLCIQKQSVKLIFEVENVSGLRAMCFPHSGRRGEEAAGSRRKSTSNRIVQVDFHPKLRMDCLNWAFFENLYTNVNFLSFGTKVHGKLHGNDKWKDPPYLLWSQCW